MKRTSLLLIGLVFLSNAGCAGRDWVSDLLVLTDVTGTWEGSVTRGSVTGSASFAITMALQQRGPKVTGALSWPREGGELEGVVTGEVVSFSRGPIRGELTVDGDEMTGNIFGPHANPAVSCGPCQVHLWREGSRVPSLSEPPARRGQ
jgi:hypothetical protein